jgi:hypothetical protein
MAVVATDIMNKDVMTNKIDRKLLSIASLQIVVNVVMRVPLKQLLPNNTRVY